ncbi:hypothetical protein MPER_14083, partial [Moniliophthora perniciosa FA553]
AYVDGIQAEDGQQSVPAESHRLIRPAFFGYGAEDYISLPALGKHAMQSFCDSERLTMHEFESNHWMHLHVPDEVNRVLLEWIESLI